MGSSLVREEYQKILGRGQRVRVWATAQGNTKKAVVRFGHGGGEESIGGIGRIPQLEAFFGPVLTADEPLVECFADLGSLPGLGESKLGMFSPVPLRLFLKLTPAALRMFRPSDVSVATAVESSDGPPPPWRTADAKLRDCVYRCVYFIAKGEDAAIETDSAGPDKQRVSASVAEEEEAVKADASLTNEGDVVSEDQRDSLLEEPASSSSDGSERARRMPRQVQPSTLVGLRLRPYQEQALSWMLQREWLETGHVTSSKVVPVEEVVDTRDIPLLPPSGVLRGDACEAMELGDEEAKEQEELIQAAMLAHGDSSQAAGNPLWQTIPFTIEGKPSRELHPSQAPRRAQATLFLNPYVRAVATCPPPSARPAASGILADEMGLGKTIQTLALILAQRDGLVDWRQPLQTMSPSSEAAIPSPLRGRVVTQDSPPTPARPAANQRPARLRVIPPPSCTVGCASCTLVVCPVSLMNQWKSEIERFTPRGHLKVLTHHGGQRLSSPRQLEGADVVISSYGMVAAEMHRLGGPQAAADVASAAARAGWPPRSRAHLRKTKLSSFFEPVIFGVRWRRVVLDEAHTIKNAQTDTSKACLAIEAVHRWALTGTPVQNSLKDLHSLLRFMRHQPWDEPSWWRRVIAQPYEAGDAKALQWLKLVLRPLLLRRTKAMRDVDGQPIVSLPPKHIEMTWLELSESERAFYDTLFSRSKATFEGFEAAGSVLNQYAVILSLLIRLRQACGHPFLVLGRKRSAEADDASDVDGAGLSSALVRKLIRRFMDSDAARSSSSTAAAEPSDLMVGTGRGRVQQQAAETLAPHVLDMLRQLQEKGYDGLECPICLEQVVAPVLTSCAHIACDACLQQAFRSSPGRRCPVCRESLPSRKDVIPISAGASDGAVAAPDLDTAYVPSTKLLEIFRTLDAIDRHNLRCKRRRELVRLQVASSSSEETQIARTKRPRRATERAPPAKRAKSTQIAREQPSSSSPVPDTRRRSARLTASRRPAPSPSSPSSADSEDEDDDSSSVALSLHLSLPPPDDDDDFQPPSAKKTSVSSRHHHLNNNNKNDEEEEKEEQEEELWVVEDDSEPDEDEQSHPTKLRTASVFRQAKEKLGGAAEWDWAGPVGDWSRRGDPMGEEQWPGQLLFEEVGIYTVPTTSRPCVRGDDGRAHPEPSELETVAEDGCLWRRLWLENVKVVLFSQWTSMLDIVQAGLVRRGSRFERIDGSMTATQRDSALSAFCSQAGPCVMLVSTQAGGQGLNVVEASVVLMLDPWWNPAAEHQAISRVHRIGQVRAVSVKRLLCRGTVEETLVELQNKKQLIANSALEAGSSSAESKLTVEELRSFFR
jgi:SNF2 family DNA or RNA helicase